MVQSSANWNTTANNNIKKRRKKEQNKIKDLAIMVALRSAAVGIKASA